MEEVVTVGLDIAKSVFQVHGVDAEGRVVMQRKLARAKLIAFFEKLPRCLIGIEACTTAHRWGRRLTELVIHRTRMTLMRHRIELSNTIRAHMAEFGLAAPIGRRGLQGLIEIVRDEADERVPASARICLKLLADQLDLVNRQALETDRLILASARATDIGRRLMAVPGVGPVLASAIVASVPDPHAFKTGRNLAAWIGLVPKQNSSGGKARLGGITRQGNRYLRQLLVIGALAVIRYAERHATRRPWLVQLMARRTTKVAAVALANKTARMVWAIMTGGEAYREPPLQAA